MAMDRSHRQRSQSQLIGSILHVSSQPDEFPYQAWILAAAPGTNEYEHAGRFMSVCSRTDAGKEIGIASVVKKTVKKTSVCRVPHGA
jgi:hypothetical protein